MLRRLKIPLTPPPPVVVWSAMSKAKKKEEPAYNLTPKGLFMLALDSEDLGNMVADRLELYLRRTGQAVAIEHNNLRFVQIVPVTP